MFLSPRELILLKELMATSEPVSVERMTSLLKVSRRTVYREITQLEQSLASINAQLEKVGRGHYRLSADAPTLSKLVEEINESAAQLSTSERQHAILLELLTKDIPISMHSFLDRYLISNTTFFADIKQLEEQITRLPLKIVRNRGYEINGSEKYRRLLMANILVQEINEYQFFNFSYETEKNFSLQFVNHAHLRFAQEVIYEIVEPTFQTLSDRKLVFLTLMLTIAMDRVPLGFTIMEETYPNQLNKGMLDVSKQVFAKVGRVTKQLYAVSEIIFFANLLSDFANSFDDDFFSDTFNSQLAYQVKSLIETISEATEVNFFEDANLYKMLLTHISAALSRAIVPESSLNNPILERIMNQYEEIGQALKNKLPIIFPKQPFSEEEIAYMLLHFANSLERSPRVMEVDIAGISPSGLASTSMLEMRLRKYFPFINRIDFYRVAELNRLNLSKQYDLIISTSLLLGYTGKYKLISPLLAEDELKELREEFKKISRKKEPIKLAPKQILEHQEAYQEVMSYIEDIQSLLVRFYVKTINNPQTISETILMVTKTFSAKLVDNPEQVAEKLLQRYHQAPIGIPQTNFALFHTAHSEIKEPCFCIFDLEKPLTILGMDRQEMDLHRLLIMLAPDPITSNNSKIFGKISGAIIMNDLNTEIFNSGNQAIIYQLLATLLIEEIKE